MTLLLGQYLYAFSSARPVLLSGPSIVEWSGINELPLNVNKCKILRFMRTNNPVVYSYTINDTKVNSVYEEVDFDILLTSILSFTPHIYNITLKA